ncbi:MAG: DUF1152 domain-containing protein, partial [Anaerolineales bacterium]
MKLNLPVFDQLAACKNLLIAGMGGGYDVFCGLPIYFELKKRGISAHLANFSFSDIETAQYGIRLSKTLVGITAESDRIYPYFPEYYLARWFKEKRDEETVIWSFQKTGTAPLLENYKLLTAHLAIDGLLLIDGGVDSLMRGDEAEKGTLIEDATSLYVANELHNIPMKLVACVAFGVERDITYAHVLENIASLTQMGACLGVCSLVPQMEAYKQFEEAVLYVQGQRFHDPSVINSSLISAVQGQYGDYHLTEKTKGSRLWISPLMTLYWFFDLAAVARQNYFLPQLRGTHTFRDTLQRVMEHTRNLPR